MRSWLYCPGDAPDKIVNVGVYGADGIVLDLEDSVGEDQKDQARLLVAEAIASHDFGGCRLAVRVNPVGSVWWEDDLRAVTRAGARIIRLPKVESPDAPARVTGLLEALRDELEPAGETVRLQCILETPIGVENAFAIAGALRETGPSSGTSRVGRGRPLARVDALSFGAEDYCAALGLRRPGPDFALDYPRSRIAAAAAAFGLACYDTVWSDIHDESGLRNDAHRARELGFSGKSAIHPRQVDIVNDVFSPSPGEIAWARRVVEATTPDHGGDTPTDRSATGGFGVTAVDGAMIDAPVVRRAMRILREAEGVRG